MTVQDRAYSSPRSGRFVFGCRDARHVWLPIVVTVLAAAGLPACAHPERLASPPREVALEAVVMDLPQARFWPVHETHKFIAEGKRSLEREMAYLNVTDFGDLPPANFLAVSGGGDDGAFGAGFLVGWTESGTRPEFKMVTGISTGALISPFAFLGSAYDESLSKMYTTISAGDIYEERGPIAALYDDAAADSAPLLGLIAERVDEEMVTAIAREYGRGRLLFIGTTNLDAKEPIIWNVGAIAASGHPSARELIHRIMLASASIPGVFPPVMFDVDIGGKPYQEMHVDGGAIVQLFLYPPAAAEEFKDAGIERERRAFVIRNGHSHIVWEPVERQALEVVGKAISTMIFFSGINDITRTYFIARRDGVDFNYTYIAADFEAPDSDGDFDPKYMNALYSYGYDKARVGFEWRKAPSHLRIPPPQ